MNAPDWNALRLRPERAGGHVESHFLKLNDPGGRRALWLKATVLRRLDGEAVAEAWGIAFDREAGHAAAKQVVPFGSADFSRSALDIRLADARLEPTGTRGVLRTDGGTLECGT